MPDVITDCRSTEGVTVGLIDSLMSIAQVICERGVHTDAEREAIADLRSNEYVRALLDMDWLEGELQAEIDLRTGNYKTFDTIEELIAELESEDE